MKNTRRVIAVLVVLVWTGLLFSQTPAAEPEAAHAAARDPGGIGPGMAVPRLIKFSGAFLDQAGKAMTGVHGLTVAVYKDQQGGAPLWIETQNADFDAQGRYTILLGATKTGGVPLELFTSDEPRWLGIQMQLPGWQEEPRVLLVSVPYALKAAEAETFAGLPLSSFVLTPEAAKKAGREGSERGLAAGTTLPVAAVSGTGTANKLPKWLDAIGTLGDSTVTDTGSGVGVGTPSPSAPLHVRVTGPSDPILKLEGTNPTDSLSMKVTHPGAVVGFALAGGAGAFVSTAGADDAIIFGQAGKNLLLSLGGTEGMRVTAAGNVGVVNKLGIGFNAPTAPIHILTNGNTDPALYVQGVNETDSLSFKITHPNAVVGFALAGGGGAFVPTSAQHDAILFGQSGRNLLLSLGGTEHMRVATSGNIGIGTPTPAEKLDVAGNINASGSVTATSYTGSGAGLTGIAQLSSQNTFTAAPTGTGVNQGPLYVNPAAAGAGETLLGLAVGGTEKFRVDTSGSVTTSATVNLPATADSATGVLNLSGARFLHRFGGVTNVFVGTNAGNFTMTGTNNTALGTAALVSNSLGNANTATGYNALFSNGTGSNNTATGQAALRSNTAGSSNSAFGDNALFSNNGDLNTATGFAALYSNNAGIYNTATGTSALYSNTTGNNNTALGSLAGTTSTPANANTTGSKNTFLGHNSGPGVASASSLYNATAIGADAVVSVGNALVLGSIAGINGAVATVNVGIGTATPSVRLDVNGHMRTSGNLALPDTVSSSFGVITLGGLRFLHGFGDLRNTFVGREAGNFSMTGVNNTATGRLALSTSTSGYENTGTGSFALFSNTSGYDNIATGFFAGYANTSGHENSAVGTASLRFNTTGNHNTAVGTYALFKNSTGSHNTSVGYSAGVTTDATNGNTTGSSNTFIGSYSGPGVAFPPELQNATAIGANATVSTSDSLVLGSISGVNGATASVNVGIGTASPGKPLDVVGDIRTSTCVIASSGTIGGVCSSDRRLKKDIQAFPQVLNRLVELRPVSFHWREELPEYHLGSAKAVGLIAQDVEQVFPEMVSTDKRGYKQVNYSELPYLMLQAIRELKSENDKLREELRTQQEQWEQRLRRLEALGGR